MVRSATPKPSSFSSPGIRGAPQVGFSRAMRRMSLRSSGSILGRRVAASASAIARKRGIPVDASGRRSPGPHDHEGLAPIGPEALEADPEELAAGRHPRSRLAAVKDRELRAAGSAWAGYRRYAILAPRRICLPRRKRTRRDPPPPADPRDISFTIDRQRWVGKREWRSESRPPLRCDSDILIGDVDTLRCFRRSASGRLHRQALPGPCPERHAAAGRAPGSGRGSAAENGARDRRAFLPSCAARDRGSGSSSARRPIERRRSPRRSERWKAARS